MLGQLSGLELNPLLSAIKLTSNDKIICVREVGLADSNFIITYLMKKIFQTHDKLIFVNFHNTLDHYQLVGKKLGFDLLNKVQVGDAVIVDMLKNVEEEISNEDSKFFENSEEFVEKLFCRIELKADEIISTNDNQTFLIIDDLTHLLDIGVNIECVVKFITRCCNLKSNSVSVVINNHVSPYESNDEILPEDNIIANSLSYISDLEIEVAPLQTGHSKDVSGVINITRPGEVITKLHYKAYDRGIKTFKPGESLMNLLK
ncbi:uncharacterized protein LOC123316349 [Coccinella septempunctata]|uniref:uncharacterized protein LOC123316349 n=1 Tax=Coccinella septempunctata TaxID=41139 RepID=UPI001D0817CD|nr:uncharacterized protein LOC123316349 [Coccinella septempunctata]